jgi:hypothetical protein
VRTRDEQTEPALERVGGDPRFIVPFDVLATRDDGRLDAFSAMSWDAFDIENGDRHTASL